MTTYCLWASSFIFFLHLLRQVANGRQLRRPYPEEIAQFVVGGIRRYVSRVGAARGRDLGHFRRSALGRSCLEKDERLGVSDAAIFTQRRRGQVFAIVAVGPRNRPAAARPSA